MSANLLEKKTNEVVEEKQEKQEKRTTRKKKQRIRKFPIWLRLIVVFILFTVSLMVGLMVGYGVIGDGNAFDALKVETWQHILDIIQKEK